MPKTTNFPMPNADDSEKFLVKKDSLTPVFSVLCKHAENKHASFHTPGHKGHAGLLAGVDLLKHDLTELPSTMDLFNNNSSGDVISISEKLAANAFGAYDSFFSAGGCTPCIQTMIFIAAKNCGLFSGKKLLCGRNSHKSLVNTCGLLDIEIIWAYGENSDNAHLTGSQIAPAEIARELRGKKGEIGAVYITSPDYYGRIADVKSISAICEEYSVPLLVDNAHGSHLGSFGCHPLALGADVTADSLHKTLPVLTGGAVLQVSKKAYDSYGFERKQVKAAMQRFTSTSPSFNVLSSIDLARDWWKRVGKEIYNLTAEQVGKICENAKAAGVEFLNTENSTFTHDPTRIVINAAEMGLSGEQAAEFLRSYKCEPEFSDESFCVLIVTPFNNPEELSSLEEALVAFGIANKRGRFWRKRKAHKGNDEEFLENPFIRPVRKMSIRQAITSKSISVSLQNSIGKIAADIVCSCPPGVPIVVPGEDISEYAVSIMKKAGFSHVEIVDN